MKILRYVLFCVLLEENILKGLWERYRRTEKLMIEEREGELKQPWIRQAKMRYNARVDALVRYRRFDPSSE